MSHGSKKATARWGRDPVSRIRRLYRKKIQKGMPKKAVPSQSATPSEQMEAAVRSMTTLNKTAAEIARRYEVHAATDVTGFSFLGHLLEMMGEKLSSVIDANAVPILPGAWEAADACLYTAAGQRNRNHTGPFVRFEKVPFPMEEILFDPQTSGGLLFAVAPQDAAALEAALQAAGLPAKVVGTIGEKQTPEITVTYE